MIHPPKYPSTPHWPLSMSVQRGDTLHKNHQIFVGKEVVITEKIDGGNTALWNGNVYARSVVQPATDGWFAMVKKHHGWKTVELDPTVVVYGEDIYGIHSIEYDAISEDETYRIFAAREFDVENAPDRSTGRFLSWDTTVELAHQLDIQTVPILFRGVFNSVNAITDFFNNNISSPSAIGPEKEGFVMRIADGFAASDFAKYTCKFVRPNHVQTTQHWRQEWKPCCLK